MKIVRLGKRYRIKDIFEGNFWIDVDPERQEINVSATGPIKLSTAGHLLHAIQYALDLATGIIEIPKE